MPDKRMFTMKMKMAFIQDEKIRSLVYKGYFAYDEQNDQWYELWEVPASQVILRSVI